MADVLTAPHPLLWPIASAARAEYDRRYAKAVTLDSGGYFNHDIADRLHNWQRIAWLLDPAGRTEDHAVLIATQDLQAMTAEAQNCRDIWLDKHRAAPADPVINARARALSHITRTLEIRLNSARKFARPMELEKAA